LACAVSEDRRNQEIVRGALDFIAHILVGTSDEPTPDKPVIETSSMSERSQTKVKKVLDVGYEERMRKLAEESMATRRDMAEAIEKVRNMPIDKPGAKSG
jgi:hypothetical protein